MPPAFIQSTTSAGASTASAPIAYPSSPTAGHLLVAVGMSEGAVTLGVSDSQGNTWTPIGSQTGVGANSSATWRGWYAIANTTGPVTVTFTASPSSPFLLGYIAEYTWPTGTVSVDGPQLVNDIPSSLNYPSLVFTTNSTSELQFVTGVINATEASQTVNAPFTKRATASQNYLIADNLSASGTDTFSATAPSAAASGSFGFGLSSTAIGGSGSNTSNAMGVGAMYGMTNQLVRQV